MVDVDDDGLAHGRAWGRRDAQGGAVQTLARRLLSVAPMVITTRLVAFVALVIALTAATPARADRAAPLRITIECQSYGRTKACPAFLRGFVDATPLMLASPRATAQVVLYVTAVPIANADRLHLRYVGDVRGAPPSIEVDVDVDTRADDDTQRAQLQPAFLRGVALFIGALYPDAVAIELTPPEGDDAAPVATSPWGWSLTLSGFGSATGPYKSANAYGAVDVSRVETDTKWSGSVGASGGLSRSPEVEGVSFDTNRWSVYADSAYERHLNGCYAMQVATSLWRDDPHGQFRYGWNTSVGLEWDRYPSDDPRGNVLAAAYTVGYRVEGYNFPNELRERFAHYAQHGLAFGASVRKDKVTFNVQLHAKAELLHPTRRFTLSASPGVEIQLGDHIDLAFDASITRRELPEFIIPDDDAEAIGRADYAEPTSMYSSVSVRFHWDATNGARNNRFGNL